jgi:3-hydroxyisobutyrate dehydrogenase
MRLLRRRAARCCALLLPQYRSCQGRYPWRFGFRDKASYEKALPLFEKLSKTQYLLGDGEQARVLKLAINSMLACNMMILAEAMVIAEKSGMKIEDATQVISTSVVGSPVIGYKVALVNANDYKPAFNINMMIKDLDLAFAAAKQYGVGMPATALTRQMSALPSPPAWGA